MFNYLCLLREGKPTAELFGIFAVHACEGRQGPFIYSSKEHRPVSKSL